MKKAILIVHTKTFCPRMPELGVIVARSGQFESVFHFAYKPSCTRRGDPAATATS